MPLPPARFNQTRESTTPAPAAISQPSTAILHGFKTTTADSQYLQAAVGRVLVAGLTQALASRCADPIDALGRFLLNYDATRAAVEREDAERALRKQMLQDMQLQPAIDNDRKAPANDHESDAPINLADIFRPPTPPAPQAPPPNPGSALLSDPLPKDLAGGEEPESAALAAGSDEETAHLAPAEQAQEDASAGPQDDRADPASTEAAEPPAAEEDVAQGRDPSRQSSAANSDSEDVGPAAEAAAAEGGLTVAELEQDSQAIEPGDEAEEASVQEEDEGAIESNAALPGPDANAGPDA
ncbi:hypothetical protein HDU84_004047 [Entophlyctis sp. JEL0112]|nr:hypothetical protein HDU84_004047 [Entophlyctis sp. JEL0112]